MKDSNLSKNRVTTLAKSTSYVIKLSSVLHSQGWRTTMELLQMPILAIVPLHAWLQTSPFLGATYRPLRSLKHQYFFPLPAVMLSCPCSLRRSSRSLDVTARLVDNVHGITVYDEMLRTTDLPVMSSSRQTRHEHAHGFDKPMLGFFTPKSVDNESELRKHFVAASGEFVGTFLFLFTAYLGHSMSVTFAPDSAPGGGNANQTVVFIALSYGFSLLIAAWVLYRISGGLFNPAVTLGMVITGTLPPMRGLVLFPAQILGAMSAAGVVSGIIPADIAIVQTTLAPNVSIAQGLFLEMFLTAHLIFTILMLAAEKSKDTFIAPIGIGLSLFVVEIAGVNYSGASVNPARSFGPCVAAADFPGYFWIYFVGPVLGALLAAGFYHFVKFFNYEDANPGQDSAGVEEEFNIKPAESDLENGSRRN